MASRADFNRSNYRDAAERNDNDFDSDSSTPDRFKNQICTSATNNSIRITSSNSYSYSQRHINKKPIFHLKSRKHQPQQSYSTAFSPDDSRGGWSTGSIHVSKLTDSGDRLRMIPSNSNRRVNDNRPRGHGNLYGKGYECNAYHSHGDIGYRSRNQSLASKSTVYHDATAATSISHSNRYSPHQYGYEYGYGCVPASVHELSMPVQTQMQSPQSDRQIINQASYNLKTPTKYDTILAPDDKSIWNRLKKIFEGKEDACQPTLDKEIGLGTSGGLFCNCTKAINSPDTPDWNQNGSIMDENLHYSAYSDSHYDAAMVQHHYMSFKDGDGNAEKKLDTARHDTECNRMNENAKTVKKRNSIEVDVRHGEIGYDSAHRTFQHGVRAHVQDNDDEDEHVYKHDNEDGRGYSLVSLGEVVHYLSADDIDSNQYQYDTELKLTPPFCERESRRRLFGTLGGSNTPEDESPDSIPPTESPMSDMDSVYHIANDLDSYAGDADTVRNVDIRRRFNSDSYSLPGNTELNYVSVPESNTIQANRTPSPVRTSNITNGSSKNNLNTVSSRPPIENRQSSTSVRLTSPISPMNTIGTQGTMHRRVNSTCTFTANSLALIFDLNETSPKKRTTIPVVPKTVKTIKKKSRDGNDRFDDISPLDDNEDSRMRSRSFRERMNKIDCAIDDDATCSPIQRQEQKSFDFSQNPTAVDLFGKENIEPMTVACTDRRVLSPTLGRNSIQKSLPDVHVVQDPAGVYLPVTTFFKEEKCSKHSECSFEGWVAYSKETQAKDGLLQYVQDKNKLKRKHLRYIIISGDLMYVHASRRLPEDSVAGESCTDDSRCTNTKVLKLSKHMSVEVKDVSRQHGKCIIVKDSRLIGVRKSEIVCTMLPVRLTSAFFKDESCAEVVDSLEFEQVRGGMFGEKAAPEPMVSKPICPILRPNGMKECRTPHPGSTKKKPNLRSAEWPKTVCETVPTEQNTAALFMQFALDTAMRGKMSSKSS